MYLVIYVLRFIHIYLELLNWLFFLFYKKVIGVCLLLLNRLAFFIGFYLLFLYSLKFLTRFGIFQFRSVQNFLKNDFFVGSRHELVDFFIEVFFHLVKTFHKSFEVIVHLLFILIQVEQFFFFVFCLLNKLKNVLNLLLIIFEDGFKGVFFNIRNDSLIILSEVKVTIFYLLFVFL